jgi:hypothetical protein
MSANCMQCVKNPRTGPDLLCDECRAPAAGGKETMIRKGENNQCALDGCPEYNSIDDLIQDVRADFKRIVLPARRNA